MRAGSGCRWRPQPTRWLRPWLWGWPSSNWARCWPGRVTGLKLEPVRWAVTYTNPLAARWSGTPLGVPLHPVQAYAALAFLSLSILLLVWLPARRQQGDVVGLWLLGTGVAVFLTELWRDPEGRGALLGGALDGPQVAAMLLVLAGGLVLLERKGTDRGSWYPTLSAEKSGKDGARRLLMDSAAKDEAADVEAGNFNAHHRSAGGGQGAAARSVSWPRNWRG